MVAGVKPPARAKGAKHSRPGPKSIDKAPGGSQSIQRALGLLRLISAANADGMRLADVAQAAKLHLATTHRLLRALVYERFVTYDPDSRLYRLGIEFLALGDDLRERQLVRLYRPALRQIAEATGDGVYLSTISGEDVIYIDRVEGRYPIRTLTLDVGARRPLGIGSSGVALLAAMPAERMEAVLSANQTRYAEFNGITADEVRAMVRKCRKDGYSFNNSRLIPGISSIAIVLADKSARPLASISVSALNERMTLERRRWIVDITRKAVGTALS
ncbi:MAG TPA: IclR family transcriptional regulator [Reyranella sp.]|nr:IclR family transcriptional regulator [Reyranella sp.]